MHTLLGEAGSPLPKDALIIALSGIASPGLFFTYLGERYELIDQLVYPDHHQFRPRDFTAISERWQELCEQYSGRPVYIVCTEKDAVRFTDSLGELPEALVKQLYFLPIETQILYKPQEFRDMICKAANSPASLPARAALRGFSSPIEGAALAVPIPSILYLYATNRDLFARRICAHQAPDPRLPHTA